jgi:hypothetical protein
MNVAIPACKFQEGFSVCIPTLPGLEVGVSMFLFPFENFQWILSPSSVKAAG